MKNKAEIFMKKYMQNFSKWKHAKNADIILKDILKKNTKSKRKVDILLL